MSNLLYEKLYMGIVYDAMRLLGYKDDDFYINIKPKNITKKILYGPALTTYGEIVNVSVEEYRRLDRIRLEIYDERMFENKPIVVLQANDNKVAHSGDITSEIYKKLGAVAFITDGNVRDIENIKDIRFSVFCNDINPIDALDYWAITKYNIDIELDNVKISEGDMLFGSSDGVIVVPKKSIDKFDIEAANILQKEDDVRKLLRDTHQKRNIKGALGKYMKTFGRW